METKTKIGLISIVILLTFYIIMWLGPFLEEKVLLLKRGFQITYTFIGTVILVAIYLIIIIAI